MTVLTADNPVANAYILLKGSFPRIFALTLKHDVYGLQKILWSLGDPIVDLTITVIAQATKADCFLPLPPVWNSLCLLDGRHLRQTSHLFNHRRRVQRSLKNDQMDAWGAWLMKPPSSFFPVP